MLEQTDIEILLKLLASDLKFLKKYLPEKVDGKGFDVGGFFVPTNASQVICFIGQHIIIDSSQEWTSEEKMDAQKLCSLLWLISEYGRQTLQNDIFMSDIEFSYYYDGIRNIIRDIAVRLIESRKYDTLPPNRLFEDVFMRDSFQIKK